MAYSLQQSINWAQTYIEFSPLSAGTNNEPAISVASMVRNTILNAPMCWPWNRAEFSLTGVNALQLGVQDYTFPVTNFAYLEKISLLEPAPGTYGYELTDIYNINTLGVASTNATAQPKAAAVKFYVPGTSVSIRFLSNPDQAYTGTLTYQMLSVPFAALTDTWAPIPDSFSDVFNNLFLAEAMEIVDDARGAQYRQRGIAALLSKAEGLSDMQVNAFLSQYIMRGPSQELRAQLKAQQSIQARGV
jgi:hypothetical protein